MFELLSIANLFCCIYLLVKNRSKSPEQQKIVKSSIDKIKNNTSSLFSRLYGDY